MGRVGGTGLKRRSYVDDNVVVGAVELAKLGSVGDLDRARLVEAEDLDTTAGRAHAHKQHEPGCVRQGSAARGSVRARRGRGHVRGAAGRLEDGVLHREVLLLALERGRHAGERRFLHFLLRERRNTQVRKRYKLDDEVTSAGCTWVRARRANGQTTSTRRCPSHPTPKLLWHVLLFVFALWNGHIRRS